LIKWEGYGPEDNSWEYKDNISAPELVTRFHQQNPGAPRQIRALAFGSIPFRPITSLPIASRRCSFEGGVIVRGTPLPISEAPISGSDVPEFRSAPPVRT
jgi:hypothetical protein